MRKYLLITMLVLLLLPTVMAQTQIATDDFECGAFNCGAGWTGSWGYTGSCEITTLGTPLDTYHMRGFSLCDATKNLDTTGYTDVNVTFYATAGGLENGDYCYYYYYDGTENHLLLTLTNGDDDNEHDYYEFNITGYGLNSNSGIRMAGAQSTGDYCYIDNVTFEGVTSTDLNLFVDENYLAGSTGHTIEATSSITNTQHTIELAYPNGTIFCTDTITSPSISYTSFSTSCDMPNEVVTNASAKLYLTGTPTEFIIENFNVVVLTSDDNKLKIDKVYHSPQVLQGGQTEIFALLNLGNNITVDKATVTLTYPDATSRIFYMDGTLNSNEYRALITDTYQVGNVLFTVYIEAGVYYAQYSNQYTVAAYNVDFVDVVNSVKEVMVCQDVNESNMALFGTEYEIYESGTIFLQLSDGQGVPVDDGDCHLDVYYPDLVNQSHPIFISGAPMVYKIGSNGLYYYDFTVPNITGVYMLSATCAYSYSSVWAYDSTATEGPERTISVGTYSGTTEALISREDFLYQKCTASGGAAKTCDSYYDFNLTGIDTVNVTNINLYYAGEASTTATLTTYVWNWTDSSWIQLDNIISFGGESSSTSPVGINDFVSNGVPTSDTIQNDIIRIKIVGSAGSVFVQFDNWLNMRVFTEEGIVSDLKGGGEIHVSSAMTDMGWFIIEQFNSVPGNVWNYTPDRTLTVPGQQWIGGTEYSVEETEGLIVVRAMTPAFEPLLGATCTVTVVYQNTSVVINGQVMIEANGTAAQEMGGVYYANINLTGIPGVYPYGVDCVKDGKDYYMMNTFHIFDNTDMPAKIWNYTNRTLTNATNIAPDIWGGNYTINPGLLVQFVSGVWDYVSRYTHGIVN